MGQFWPDALPDAASDSYGWQRESNPGSLGLLQHLNHESRLLCNLLFLYLTQKHITCNALWGTTAALIRLSLSLRFSGHFPGEPGLAGVYWSKGWCRWWWQLDYWSYKSCKDPVKSSPATNQHPVFLQAGCPSCCPSNSVNALKGQYHIPWTCLPQAHLGIFQLCLWPLIAPDYLGEGCHASHQPSDASTVWNVISQLGNKPTFNVSVVLA